MPDKKVHIIKTVVVALLPPLANEAIQEAVVQVVSTYAAGRTNKASARSKLRVALQESGVAAPDEVLELCNTTASNLVAGYVNWQREQNDLEVLHVYPAREFIQCYERDAEAINWIERWEQNGGRLFRGKRMVALANDSIWRRISLLGLPFPPFDLGSGMDLNVISRYEAEELGLLVANEKLSPVVICDLDFECALRKRFEALFGGGS